MQVELGQIVRNQKKSFFAAIGAITLGGGDFRFDVVASLRQRFREQGNILVRPFDIVKRGFGLVAHKPPFGPPASSGWQAGSPTA